MGKTADTVTPDPHEANLFDLQAKYAEVISEAEALEKITG